MQNIFISIKKSSLAQKIIAGVFILALISFYFLLPAKLFKTPTSYVIEDSDGNLLNAAIAADGQWRFPFNKNVPQHFIDCITTYEDKRFYIHSGIDLSALGRALRANFKKISPIKISASDINIILTGEIYLKILPVSKRIIVIPPTYNVRADRALPLVTDNFSIR